MQIIRKSQYVFQKFIKKVRKILPNLILLLFVIVICVIFFEIVLRFFYPQPLNPIFLPTDDRGTFAEYDAILGWRLKSNIEGLFFSNEYNTNIKNNAQGLRMGRNVPLKKSKYRIAFLGDSFIWGFGVNEHERVSEYLEKELENVEVLNFGVSGYGTDQYYLQLNRTVLKFRPDMVIVGFYANDLEDTGNNVRYSYPKPLFKLADDGSLNLTNVPVPKKVEWDAREYSFLTKLKFFLSHKSHVFFLFKRVLFRLYPYQEHTYDPSEISIILKEYPKDYQVYNQLNEMLYCKMAEMLREHNITFIVINIPPKIHLLQDKFSNTLKELQIDSDEIDINKPSMMLHNLSINCGLDFIDLYPYFREYKYKERLYFWYDPHWNPLGHKYAAKILSKELKDRYNIG